jgi:pimeloyl-ACP methyl ester carboxylesterase
MVERMVRANGVDLCVEGVGDPSDPAILLVMGAGASMLYWDAEFCGRLAAAGRFVIRYDHRDTGRSTTSPAGSPDYALRDLVDDAAGVLDAFGVASAHVVGMSMGAAIGQLLALDHASRVRSLTLTCSTPGGPGHDAPDLPPMSDELAALFAQEPAEPDWSDRAAVIDHHVAGERAYAGTLPFDEAGWQQVAARTYDRSTDMAASFTNHFLVDAGEPWRHRLAAVAHPTLVLHGTDDPFLPFGHGVALAAEIPGARLVAVDGAGHEPPPRVRWDVIVPAVVAHTAS